MVDSKENYKFDLGFKELTIMNFLVGDKFLYLSNLRLDSEVKLHKEIRCEQFLRD